MLTTHTDSSNFSYVKISLRTVSSYVKLTCIHVLSSLRGIYVNVHYPLILRLMQGKFGGFRTKTFAYPLKTAFYLYEYVTISKTVDIFLQPVD